jgi:catechol 2,3-dioxygenase-like lactoylglutathione lyase family enzyme
MEGSLLQLKLFTMHLSLAQIAIVVHDYDEAIAFYCDKLGFTLIEDTVMSASKRWVVVSPNDGNGCRLLLAKAANEEQASRVGNQTGGRVFLFLHTSNFDAMYNRLLEQQITIVRPPSSEAYGRVCVFADGYGNLWDLIEPAE